MKQITHSVVLGSLLLAAAAVQAADTRCFEMRVYYAAPGKLEALQARFRDHTCKLFAKHGMTNIGYWVPMENLDNKLVYLLAYPSRAEREKSWKAFMDDPEWKAAYKASEVNGKLVTKSDVIFLQATDFSPEVKVAAVEPSRVFEMRTYKASPGKLPNLLARFRDHTCKLFEKHGMTNVGYWTPTDKAKGADDTLIYILAHKSKEAGAESFKNFRADPAWKEAREASEKAAGGSLTANYGVKSELMAPADFSPMK